MGPHAATVLLFNFDLNHLCPLGNTVINVELAWPSGHSVASG